MKPMRLTVLPGAYTICRLDPDAPLPDWATGPFVSASRSASELSLVCRSDRVPTEVTGEDGWRCLQVDTELEISSVGVIASLTAPLADENVPCFVISTYETDYVLVRRVKDAAVALRRAGHQVSGALA